MQVHRVQHGAPDVVLALVVGAVADAHRPGVVVTGQVVEFVFDEFALAADGVHHLQGMALAVVGAGHVGDEREEVVGLAVQSQGVEAPEREGGVAHPGVAVVPVALTLRRFRQRRGARREQGAGRRIRQPLQGQSAALQVGPPRMVGEVADVDPLPPGLAGLPHLVGGFFVRLRRRMLGPAQRDEHVVALFEPGPGPRLPAFQPDPQVGGQSKCRMGVRIFAGARDRLTVGVGGVLPGGVHAGVVERRLAVHHQLDGAAHALHGPQQDMFGIPVHRGPAMRPRAGVDVVPRPHDQCIPHDHPAGVGLPGGLHDQAARQVAARGRHRHPIGAEPEMTGAAVQDRAEDAGGVRPRYAQPFDGAGRGDQAGVLAVGQEGIVRDRRERVAQRPTGRVRHRRGEGQRRGRFEARHVGGAVAPGLGLQNHGDIIDWKGAWRLLLGADDYFAVTSMFGSRGTA